MTTGHTADLFPETQGAIIPMEWVSEARNEYGYPLITARLLPKRAEDGVWHVGWLVHAEKALDEWHPSNPDAYKMHAAYPWYRLDALPFARSRDVAMANAGRAVKIVLAQMLPFVDPALHAEVQRIQEQIEAQARAWLQ